MVFQGSGSNSPNGTGLPSGKSSPGTSPTAGEGCHATAEEPVAKYFCSLISYMDNYTHQSNTLVTWQVFNGHITLQRQRNRITNEATNN